MPEDRPRTRRYALAMRLPARPPACRARTPQREYSGRTRPAGMRSRADREGWTRAALPAPEMPRRDLATVQADRLAGTQTVLPRPSRPKRRPSAITRQNG